MHYTSQSTAKVHDCTESYGVHTRILGGNTDGKYQEKSGLDGKLVGYASTGMMHNAKTWVAENPTS